MVASSVVNKGARNRYDELDGLRALSVLGIVAFHMFPATGLWFTVNLFFVLSGFFITTNLRASDRSSLWRYVAVFYRKRIVRIVPLYLCYLGVLAGLYGTIMSLGVLPRYSTSLLTFTYNLTRAAPDWIFNEYFTHFWSLSVEMQFYLIWPWVMVFCPARWLPAVCVGIIGATPLWRYELSEWFLAHGVPLNAIADCVYWSTLGHFDAFAAGALVAMFLGASESSRRRWQQAGFLLLVLAGVGNIFYLGAVPGYDAKLLVSLGYPIHNTHALQHIWAGSVLTIAWATLVWRLVGDREGVWWFTRLLRRASFVDIGRVSYGMYIWHWLVLMTLSECFPTQSTLLRVVIVFPAASAVTYLLAKCSNRLIEAPAQRYFR